MAKLSIKPGSTDVGFPIFIQDSTSTTGAGKTGLAYNTSSLTCYYVRYGSAAAALTLATQTVTGAHSDGGFVEVDATNMPGVYRLDLSDAVVAAGARSVTVMLKGATGMAPLLLELDLNSEVNTTHISGTTQTARDIGASVLLAAATHTGAVIPTVTTLTNAPSDSSGTTTLLSRVVGTLATGTHNPQSGDAYARLGAPAGASVSADIAALPTAGENADQVWDEARADHVIAGSFGDVDTTADIADAIWDEARSGHVTAGTFGEGAASVQGNVTGSVGSVTGAVGSVTGAVGSVTGNVTGSVGSLATQAKADVNAEVVDALATDTYAESSAVPAATSTLAAKLTWLATLGRNKVTQTATTQTLRNDADGGNVATAAVSDDGTTFVRGEWT